MATVMLGALAALAIVTQDQTALRAGPRDAAAQHAVLWQGDALEVRGHKMDYLQVWDHRRERAGYVRASQVRLTDLQPADADPLLAVMRFLRDQPGSEALGIAYAAAYLQAVPAHKLDAEPFDAIGTMADRLARRAAARAGQAAPAIVAAHLEGVSHYGVRIVGTERDGQLQPCYDGEAFRRVLALPSSTPVQRARAALGLTRHDCVDAGLSPAQRLPLDQWRAQVLDAVSGADFADLPEQTKNRLRLRRAGVWAGLAFQHARGADPAAATAAGQRARVELASVDKTELSDEDRMTYAEAAIRVGAARWAVEPAPAAARKAGLQVQVVAGEAPGQTCVNLIDTRNAPARQLARRCTYGLVWAASAQANASHSALAIAVQPLDGWREQWVFWQQDRQWHVDVLPPAASLASPGQALGYVEFAGWVPGQSRMLLARETRVDGRTRRSFDVLRLDTLQVEKTASSPDQLSAFRWQDAAWKRQTVAVR
ncbi:MAG: hypothetical protein L6Q73_04135 [Aquabacterium sp.]|nr:hypothetical protein [Aquabacterium sp.]